MTHSTIHPKELAWWRSLTADMQSRLMAAHEGRQQVDVDGYPGTLVLPDELVAMFYAEHRAPDYPPSWPTPFLEPRYPAPDNSETEDDDQ